MATTSRLSHSARSWKTVATPRCLRLRRSAHGDLAPGEDDVALVGLVDARDHLDEGGLAGTVVAHERDHLTGTHVEMDVRQRLHGTEPLGDAGQGEDDLVPGRRLGRQVVIS